MVDFSNIERLNPSADDSVSLEVVVSGLEIPMVFQVLPALKCNKRFLNAQMREASKLERRKNRDLSATEVQRLTHVLRDNYADYIVEGWSDVIDVNGEDVPYNKENCRALMRALPEEAFDQIMEFCQEPTNFVAEFGADLGKP
jgi:hypothetical protein